MRRAIVVGCGGQDGYYLCEHLKGLGYCVMGLARDAAIDEAGNRHAPVSIDDPAQVRRLVADIRPDEIYHLAAHHHSSEEYPGDDLALFDKSFSTHTRSLLVFLDAIRTCAPAARLFYAASALVFGEAERAPQNEDTPMQPDCAYGISKAAGIQICRYYRTGHGLFCVAGILYSHESPRRPPRFVSRRIVQTAVRIASGKETELPLGDPEATIDWGYAPDFVDAMHRMLQIDTPQDFVVATGRPARLRDFVDLVFSRLDLEPEAHLRTDPGRMVRRRRTPLVGDSSRLNAMTGWRPRHDLTDLARIMVDAERAA